LNPHSQAHVFEGPSGALEGLVDWPTASRGVAVIAHPHPLFGGTMDNKVVQTLARAFVQCGWTAVRFNFRGVGASAGQYDEGQGELQDLLAVRQQAVVLQAARAEPTGNPPLLALAGFSFGAYVCSLAVGALTAQFAIEKIVMVGTASSRFAVPPLPSALQLRSLVLHGEMDDTVPLSAAMDWARPQTLPVTVVPGGGHFFHGQLPLLKALVVRHLSAPNQALE
jgi:uncharacterized protein